MPFDAGQPVYPSDIVVVVVAAGGGAMAEVAEAAEDGVGVAEDELQAEQGRVTVVLKRSLAYAMIKRG